MPTREEPCTASCATQSQKTLLTDQQQAEACLVTYSGAGSGIIHRDLFVMNSDADLLYRYRQTQRLGHGCWPYRKHDRNA